jgi:hypothetical protein
MTTSPRPETVAPSGGLRQRLADMDAGQRLYTLGTLAAHLRDADQRARLRLLFADEDWMYARYEGRNRVYDGYLADLRTALDVSVTEVREQLRAGCEPSALPFCLRCILINASLNSVSGNYPPPLIARAVQEGLWEPSKALSIVSNIADLGQRLDVYIAILEVRRLPRAEQERAVREAVELVFKVWFKSEKLARLTPFLEGDSLARALAETRALKAPEDVAKGLAVLLGRLRGRARAENLSTALEAARGAGYPKDRVEALTSLVEHLRGVRRAAVIEAVYEEVGKKDYPSYDRAAALARLATRLKGESKRQVMERAHAALMGSSSFDLAYEVGPVLEHLHEPLRSQAAAEAFERVMEQPDFTMDYDEPRPVGLVGLAPYLSRKQLARAVEVIKGLSDGSSGALMQSYAFRSFAAVTEGEERAAFISAALAYAEKEDFAPSLASSLTALLPMLEGARREEVLRKVLDTASRLWDEPGNVGMDPSPRLKALAELAPFLNGKLLEEALDASLTIKDYKNLSLALVTLAAGLRDKEKLAALRAAFRAAWAMKDDQMASFTIEKVLPHMTGAVTDEAFAAVMTLPRNDTSHHWVGYVKALSPRLTPAQWSSAFDASATVEDHFHRAEVLAGLGAAVKGARRAKALGAALDALPKIEEYVSHTRAWAIRDMARWLEGELAGRALRILLKLKRHEGDEALVALAPALEGDDARLALKHVLQLKAPYALVQGVVSLLPRLTGKEREAALAQALKAALKPDEYGLSREKMMVGLVPHFEGEIRRDLLRRGFEYASDIGNPEYGADALNRLAGITDGEMRRAALLGGVKRALEISADERREDIRAEVSAHKAELLDSLFLQMDEVLLSQSLDLISTMTDGPEKAGALVSLIPYRRRKAALLREVRSFVLDHLTSLRSGNRDSLLAFLCHPTLLVPPALPRRTTAGFAREVIEICTEWRWR